MTNYKNLEAWKKSMELVNEVYLVLKTYPKEETFALTSQTKRAAISIPSNIAEGFGRNYKKDTIQFFHIARGSIYELETLLNIANMTGIIAIESFKKISLLIEECGRITNGLISYFEKSNLK
ncbi:MAG: four helix bundle protein [Bacteroidetes bacterium]|nr:four helix bundle protein [Bacteroidota bacterium]